LPAECFLKNFHGAAEAPGSLEINGFYQEGFLDPLPLTGASCEKIEIFPLTLSSPARGGGKNIEIQREIPSPLRGEGQGGGDNGRKWDSFFDPLRLALSQ
jgi:hypothetical protein